MAQLSTYLVGSAVANQIRRLNDSVFDVRVYGALGDGATDCTTAFTNAMAAATAVGGGVVYVPQGTFKISSTLDIPDKVILQGVGRGAFNNNSASSYGQTTIVWAGASNGTMLQCATLSSESVKRSEQGVLDMTLDGASLAGVGLKIISAADGRARIMVRDTKQYMLDMGVLDTGSQRSLQQWCIDIIGRNSTASTGSGIRLSGSSDGLYNVSMNYFTWVDIQVVNGTALDLYDCDTNFFHFVRGVQGGTADLVRMNGNNTVGLTSGVCRGNHIMFLSGSSTMATRIYGTETFVNPARRNFIHRIDRGNNTQLPTEGTGVETYYGSGQYNEVYNFAAAGQIKLWQDGTLGRSVIIKHVTSTPEGSVTADAGALALRGNGTLWVKASGSGNTGWQRMPSMLEIANTWDPPSLAVGASAIRTVTATGAVVGDMVLVSFSLSLSGLTLTAYVSSADNVTAVLANNTAGVVDLGSGTIKFKIIAQ